MGEYDDRAYTVGKGKPPRQHQFQPGVSGNPRGPRHKKKAVEATLSVLAHEAVNELISVTIGGKERLLPKKQAIVIGIVNDALVGSPAQRLKALQVLQGAGAFERNVEDDRQTPEMREKAHMDFIEALIQEGKRDETTRHLFAEY